MVIMDAAAGFKLCFNTCVELYNRCLQCLNPTRDPSVQSKTEFHSVRIINLTLYKYKLPAGGATIELPENIKLMHAVINPKCSDRCFMYSVMLGLIKVKAENMQTCPEPSLPCSGNKIKRQTSQILRTMFH